MSVVRPVTRRRFLVEVVTGTAVVGVIAACSSSPAATPAVPTTAAASKPAAPAPTSAPAGAPTAAPTSSAPKPLATAAPAAGQPKKGGTLTLGQTTPVVTTDPYPSNGNSAELRRAFFNNLVQVDPTGKPQPELAESWVLDEKGLGITFTLRQGVKFHDGKEFTSEEAKWSVDWAANPKSLAQSVSSLKGITTTATDKYTLQIKFPEPLPDIFSILVGVPMIEPSSDLKKGVVGTGPFKLKSIVPGDQISLVRHTEFWRQGYPLLDAYVIKAIPDASSLVINLQSGAVQAIVSPPLNQAKSLDGGATKILNIPPAGNFEFLPSTVDKPFSDLKVRQALNYAVDRQRYAQTILQGYSTPAYTMWPKGAPSYIASLDTGEFNLAKAKQMFADAGYPNGFSTTIVCSSQSFPELTTICQAFQGDMAKIGVTVKIEDQQAPQYVETVRFGRYTGLAAHGYGFADQDPALIFLARPFDVDMNPARFKSAEYKQMALDGRKETDPKKRAAIYERITQFVKDQAFVIPLATVPKLFGIRSNVQGVTFDANKMPDFTETWLA